MIWYRPYAPLFLFRAVWLPCDSTWATACMNRLSCGGSEASVRAGPAMLPTRMPVRAKTRTTIRRPDGTRNGAPSCLNGAVSAPSDGSVEAGQGERHEAAAWAHRRRQGCEAGRIVAPGLGSVRIRRSSTREQVARWSGVEVGRPDR